VRRIIKRSEGIGTVSKEFSETESRSKKGESGRSACQHEQRQCGQWAAGAAAMSHYLETSKPGVGVRRGDDKDSGGTDRDERVSE